MGEPARKSVARYSINEKFFDVWSPASAWVLGALLTDGCLHERSKGMRLDFAACDEILVANVAGALGSTSPMHEYRPGLFSWNMCNQTLCSAVRKLGVVPRKTHSVLMPEMPANVLPHFIRGCWEGDGSFWRTTQRGTRGPQGLWRADLVTASLPFARQLCRSLHDLGIFADSRRASKRAGDGFEDLPPLAIKPTVVRASSRIIRGRHAEFSQYYRIVIGSKAAMISFAKLLYEGVDEALLLPRKRDLAFQAVAELGEFVHARRSDFLDKQNRLRAPLKLALSHGTSISSAIRECVGTCSLQHWYPFALELQGELVREGKLTLGQATRHVRTTGAGLATQFWAGFRTPESAPRITLAI